MRQRPLSVVLGILGLASLPGLVHPPGRDQGIFATAGLMVLEGQVLYRDVFEVKQPLTHFLYAAALALGGGKLVAVQALDMLLRLGTVAATFALGRTLWGARRGLGAALLAGVYGLGLYGGFWEAAQAEAAAGLFLAAAGWLLLGRSHRAGSPVLAGGLLTLACACKATSLLPGGALLVLAGGLRPRILSRFALGAAGAALPFAVYFAAHGALADFYEVQVQFTRYHAWHYPWRDLLSVQAAVFLLPWALEPIALLQTLPGGAAVWALFRGGAREQVLAWWYAAAWASVLLQGKGWLYHYQILLVPQVLLMTGACGWARSLLLRGAVLAFLLVPAGASLLMWARRLPADCARLAGRLDEETYVALPRFQLVGDPEYRTRGLYRAAARLRTLARPGDRLLVFGLDQTLNALTGLLPPNRYLYSYPLVAAIPGYAAERERHRRRFLAELRRAPPRFLVIPPGPLDRVTGRTPLESLAAFSAFAAFVKRRYRVLGEVEGYVLLALRA